MFLIRNWKEKVVCYKKKHDPHLSHPVSSRRFRGQHHHWTAAGSHYSARPPPLSHHHHHYAPQSQVSVRMKNHVYGPDPPVWQHSTMGTVVVVVSAPFEKSMLNFYFLCFGFLCARRRFPHLFCCTYFGLIRIFKDFSTNYFIVIQVKMATVRSLRMTKRALMTLKEESMGLITLNQR